MYGKNCLGIDVNGGVSDMLEIVLIIADTVSADGDDMNDVFAFAKNAHTDSMGLGQIIYFPNYPAPTGEFEDHDEEDEDDEE
jgi:hypothetical protein